MNQDGEIRRRLLSIFRAELPDQLDIISNGLLRQEGLSVFPATEVDSWMRAAHNIKGAAHSVGISSIGEIAHGLETVFDALRRSPRPPATTLVDFCLQALDHIKACLAAAEEGRAPDHDIDTLVLGFDRLLVTMTDETDVLTGLGAEAVPDVTAAVLPPPAPPPLATGGKPSAPPIADKERDRDKDDLMRVAVATLDSLSATTEELQITRIGLDDQVAMLDELRRRLDRVIQWQETVWRSCGATDTSAGEVRADLRQAMSELALTARHLGSGFATRAAELGVLAASLQDQLRQTRMVAVSTLVPQLSLMVRSLCKELGKRVELDVEGGETRIDRAVLDLLRAPVTHLLRNAVDHGIESPDSRRKVGKPEVGRITVRIGLNGNQIDIVVADDGGGIDAEALAQAATRKSLLPEGEARQLSHRQKLDLVFLPGFSIKDGVTDISGRGVGLDVVLANIQRMNGSVEFDTLPGQGTRFTLRVPLTLSAEHALLVRAGGRSYALPAHAIDGVRMLTQDDVVSLEARPAIVVDGRPLPLRSLADTLGLDTPYRNPVGAPAVVLGVGRRTVALAVDGIDGLREIVIKPLKPPLDRLSGVSGGTLTGRGGIVLVLSPQDLVAAAIGIHGRPPSPDAQVKVRPSRILVADDSLTSRALQKSILECADYEVETAHDGVAAWQALQLGTFDLVVTDVDMPHMDGFELTERIKQSQRFKAMPVIIVTSMARDGDRQRGVAAGADAYMVKGQFESKLLLDLVQQLIVN